MDELVLVQNFEPKEGLSKEGVHAIDLQTMPALELLLKRSFAQLRLYVKPLVFDPRLDVAKRKQCKTHPCRKGESALLLMLR